MVTTMTIDNFGFRSTIVENYFFYLKKATNNCNKNKLTKKISFFSLCLTNYLNNKVKFRSFYIGKILVAGRP